MSRTIRMPKSRVRRGANEQVRSTQAHATRRKPEPTVEEGLAEIAEEACEAAEDGTRWDWWEEDWF